MALGVSVEVTADLVTTPGEGLVMAICTVRPDLKFGNVKVAVDCSLVAVAVVLSLGFLGRLDGVREGTVAAAICVGLLTKQFKKRLVPLEDETLMDEVFAEFCHQYEEYEDSDDAMRLER